MHVYAPQRLSERGGIAGTGILVTFEVQRPRRRRFAVPHIIRLQAVIAGGLHNALAARGAPRRAAPRVRASWRINVTRAAQTLEKEAAQRQK